MPAEGLFQRLAARGYYVPSAYHPSSFIVPGPSQNRACAINAHGSFCRFSVRFSAGSRGRFSGVLGVGPRYLFENQQLPSQQ